MRRIFLYGAVLSLWMCGEAFGDNNIHQSSVDDLWCDPETVKYDPTHALAYETLNETIQALIKQGEWKKVDEQIVSRFKRYTQDERLTNPKLTLFESALKHYRSESTQKPERWRPEEPGGDELIYQLPVSNGSTKLLKIDCTKIASDKPSAAMAYTAVALYQVAQFDLNTAQKIASNKLDAVYQSHRHRLFNGFPMWPWEMWLNGLTIDFDTHDPSPAPKTQWVFMRPSLSPVLKFDGNSDSELDVGFVVEPVGIIAYSKEDYSQWYGASPMVSITNNNGVGYGLLFRYNNWQVGAAYHDKDYDVLLYLSFDLYDLVIRKDKRTSSADAFMKQFKGAIE